MRLFLLFSIFLATTACVKTATTPVQLEHKAAAESAQDIPLAQKLRFNSQVFGSTREIWVHLPQDYAQGKAAHPVLYVLDAAQNIRHLAGAIDILSRTGQSPSMIIVGIESQNRDADYSPPLPGASTTKTQLQTFLSNELTPFIEETYRTHPYRILEGHSLGGLFAVHTLMNAPEFADAYIIVSPALWWQDEHYIERAKTHFESYTGASKNIYFGIGEEDGSGMRDELHRFVEQAKKASPNLNIAYREFPGEGHMSAPLLVNYFGLKHIFSDMALPEGLITNFSLEEFLHHENSIVRKYGETAKQTGEAYILLAYSLLEKKQYKDSIGVLSRNREAYPNWESSHSWLGDAFERAAEETTGEEKRNYLENAKSSYLAAQSINAQSGANTDRYEKAIARITKKLEAASP